ADSERSRHFYEGLLGLAPLAHAEGAPCYRLGPTRLILQPTEADPATGPRRARTEVHLEVDDVDSAVRFLAERATPVLREPEDQTDGERGAAVLDPDGYPVYLTQV